jgi:glycosyltransferase involved in cell wall biosynthesis
MRIAYLTDSFWPMVNGVAVSLTLAVPRLRELGYEIEIFAPRYHGYQDPEPYIHRWPSVAYMKNPPFFLALPVGSLMDYLRSQPWDVVHFHTPLILGWVARAFASRRRLPLVYTYHTMIESALHYMPLPNNADRLTWLASAYNRYWCDRCNAVVAPSRKVERMLLAQGIKAEVRQINYGIDVERFNGGEPRPGAHARAEWGLPAEPQLVLYVGRLGGEKNVGFLLRAFARLAQDMAPQPLHFVLAGDGNERQALEKLAAGLGLASATTFLGNVSRDRLPGLYRLADLFVSASTTEAQGVVMIEAIAAGLPVVAARDEAFDGIVFDGHNARVVNLDLDEFAGACRAVLNDAEQRAAMSRASQTVSETFSIRHHVEALGRLYTDLHERSRSNGRAP